MLTKRLTFFGMFIAMAVLVIVLTLPQQAAGAQTRPQTTGMEEQACLSCHELMYYNYDSGKWYCLNERAGDCTSCHEGNPTSLQEEEAHAGLIVHPTRHDGEKCQQCHPQDAAAHIEKFDEIAGIKMVESEITYQPDPAVREAAYTFPSELADVYEEQVSPWIYGGMLVAFGLWIFLVVRTSRL